MNRQTITAIIPAFNEEKNIKRCLESLSWCDKIVVLFMGKDKTGEIAKEMGAQVFEKYKSEKPDFRLVQKNINWAIDNCKSDWILRVDVDEEVTTELKEEILSILKLQITNYKLQSYVAYGIPRRQYFVGRFLKGGDWAYDRLVRLFRPKFARYDPIVSVHEQFKVKGKIGYLKYPLNHYSHPTLADALRKFDIYTTAESKDLHESIPSTFLKLIFLPPYILFRWMIWHKGYRDGVRGILAGGMRSYYDLMLYWKYLKYKLKVKS